MIEKVAKDYIRDETPQYGRDVMSGMHFFHDKIMKNYRQCHFIPKTNFQE